MNFRKLIHWDRAEDEIDKDLSQQFGDICLSFEAVSVLFSLLVYFSIIPRNIKMKLNESLDCRLFYICKNLDKIFEYGKLFLLLRFSLCVC